MNRQMLKSKIHRARITDSDLRYVGSITIDPELLEASDILEHELVHVLDVEEELKRYEPTVVHVNSNNEIVDVNANVGLLEVAS